MRRVSPSTYAVLIAVSFTCLNSAEVEAGARDYVEKGNKFYFKGEFVKALAEYLVADQKVEVKDREYAIAMLNIASAYRRVGDPGNSVVYLEKASEKIWGPKSGWQSMNLGFGTGLLTNESKQEWIGTENERFWVRFYSALANLELGRFDDAVIDLKMSEKLSENYPLQRYLHGWANSMLSEERENAALHFKAVATASSGKQFVAMGGGAPYATLQLARLNYLEGDTKSAVEIFNSIGPELQKNPILANQDEFLKSGTNVVLVVEKGWTENVQKDFTSKYRTVRMKIGGVESGSAHFADYSGQHDKIGGGEAVKGALASVATQEAKKQMTKGAASLIPGGGLVAGLFMGGNRKPSVKSWDKIAPSFYLYETRLPPGRHSLLAELLDDKGVVVATAEQTLEVSSSPKFASLFLYRTKK